MTRKILPPESAHGCGLKLISYRDLFPSLGTSPNILWTSAFATPARSDSSAKRFPGLRSNFFKNTTPVTPITAPLKERFVRQRSSLRRVEVCQNLSPLKLGETMENCTSTKNDLSPGDEPTLKGKENMNPSVAVKEWDDFEVGASQEAELAEQLDLLESAFDESSARVECTSTKECSNLDGPSPVIERTFSTQIKDFFDCTDSELEEGLLSVAEKAEEEIKSSASFGFKTLAGKSLGPLSQAAVEQAQKLWNTCKEDVVTAPSEEPELKTVGFKTAAGEPLPFSQAVFEKYASEFDCDEVGENLPVEVKASVLPSLPVPSPSFNLRTNISLVPKDPKLALAAKLFGDIEGIDELISGDFESTTSDSSKIKRAGASLSDPFPKDFTPKQNSKKDSSRQSLFESFASECKDLNFGFLKTLSTSSTSAVQRMPSGGMSRSSCTPSAECSSTPRGLFRTACQIRRADSKISEIMSNVICENVASNSGETTFSEPVKNGSSKAGVPSPEETMSKELDDDFENSMEFLQKLKELEETVVSDSAGASKMYHMKTQTEPVSEPQGSPIAVKRCCFEDSGGLPDLDDVELPVPAECGADESEDFSLITRSPSPVVSTRRSVSAAQSKPQYTAQDVEDLIHPVAEIPSRNPRRSLKRKRSKVER
ncbi:unnamed protein product [Notodromas monacha]|uniref:Uncharacterized protein n=1 Tax=Notodromas monacha TaxID=399045 RepID=A0A7R9BQI9_9CRUS|nr:unnamed protein product [Notodromas monacha]CAG0918470.1 unnamed protein product [Notodromas monacha]